MKDKNIRFVKGVGEVKAKQFERLGVKTVWDLLTLFPRRYENRNNVKNVADLSPEEVCSVVCKVMTPPVTKTSRGGREYSKILCCDSTGNIVITFFNQKWVVSSLVVGKTYRFYGKITLGLTGREMSSPVVEAVSSYSELPDLVPIYPSTAGLTSNVIWKTVKGLSEYMDFAEDVLPSSLRAELGIMSAKEGLRAIHFPEDEEHLRAGKKALAFTELLLFQMAMLGMKSRLEKSNGISMKDCLYLKEYESLLPFTLTTAQKKVLTEIKQDLCSQRVMTRLVQGDVGSGKTAVALGAAFLTVKNKFQCTFLAPTAVLATQHFETFTKLLSGTGINVTLLTGSTKGKPKIKKEISEGNVNIIVGTHALLQGDVKFKNLGLVVIDEQHRFGVAQRASLADKSGENTPNMLVMSATPIPRSLSLVLYGDMDVSTIDVLPMGRKKIKTFAVDSSYHERLYNFIRKGIAQGEKAYIICPLVEDEEGKSEKVSATAYYNFLKEAQFPNINMGLMYGKMPQKDKDKVMEEFKYSDMKILVSTTVIEVGVDVPEATIIIIENAECFGLSQLHQLRGRVGRGSKQSHCILVSDTKSDKTKERLKTLCRTTDGFEIAKEDLISRGPGEIFGERQNGEFKFKSATLADIETVMASRSLALSLHKGEIEGKEEIEKKALEYFTKNISENALN